MSTHHTLFSPFEFPQVFKVPSHHTKCHPDYKPYPAYALCKHALHFLLYSSSLIPHPLHLLFHPFRFHIPLYTQRDTHTTPYFYTSSYHHVSPLYLPPTSPTRLHHRFTTHYYTHIIFPQLFQLLHAPFLHSSSLHLRLHRIFLHIP